MIIEGTQFYVCVCVSYAYLNKALWGHKISLNVLNGGTYEQVRACWF